MIEDREGCAVGSAGGISIADPARPGGPSDRLELIPPQVEGDDVRRVVVGHERGLLAVVRPVDDVPPLLARHTTAAALPTHRLGVSPASWVPVMCEAVCVGGGREAVGERQNEAAEVIWSLDDEGPVE